MYVTESLLKIPTGTAFQENGTHTEQNSSIDNMKHLFICVSVVLL